MSIKGFFSSFKGQNEQPDYATVSPVQRGKMAVDVTVHGYVQLIVADAVEAGATTRVFTATSHVAKRGDIISFTSGALITREVRVQETTTNTITLCEELESAPANGVTFNVFRDKAPLVGADGGISVSTAGLATSAKQDTGNTSLASMDGKTPALVGGRRPVDGSGVTQPVSGTFWPATQPVSGAFWQATQPVSASSLPLPSGAATQTTLAAIATDTLYLASQTPALGQTTMAASSPVVIASNQSAVPVTVAAAPLNPPGRAYADSARNAYATTSVTTGAWVQLIASTAATINCLMIFDSSGQTLELGTGAAASETRKLIIPPGGFDGFVPLIIASGTRVSLRAISGTASAGEMTLTGLN